MSARTRPLSPFRSAAIRLLAALCCLLLSPLPPATARPASPPASGTHGVISAGEPLAAQAGIEILRAGGNAVDAAVAVGFALAVTHPEAGNLGGGGFLLHRRAADGKAFFIDFREKAPRRATPDLYYEAGRPVLERIQYGPLSVGVPGSVAGLCLAAERHGRLPLAKLIAPAVKLAREGFQVSSALAASLAEAWEWDTINKDPGASAVFGRNGKPLKEGERLKQPDLANLLEAISREGPKAFYGGEYAQRLARGLQGLGGVLEAQDLAEYRALERKPLHGRFRDIELWSAPPPSSGGVLLLMMLNMLEGANLAASGHNSSAALHATAEAMRRAYADRAEYLGDPDFIQVPVARLIDPSYARRRWSNFDPEKATPSAAIRAGEAAVPGGVHTTHYSVLVEGGDAVAVTTTLNWSYGSGILIPGTGVLLNNEMDDFSLGAEAPNLYGLTGGAANAVTPGKRMLSSMTPTIVARNSKAWLVLGSPGGSQIPNAILQVFLNRVEYGLPLEEALAAPRIHHQWKPDLLRFEPRSLPADVLRNLERRGHKVEMLRGWMGEVNAVEREPEGRLLGVADPRRSGQAVAW